MNFGLTSSQFLCALPIVVTLYYVIPPKIRQAFLLFVNILFYASFGSRYLLILFAEAIIAYIFGIIIQCSTKNLIRDIAIGVGICLIATVLLCFKVGRLFFDTITAPLGLSFYSLQVVSYLVDVNKRKIIAERNYTKLLTYLSFFPTITSGPIFRYHDFEREYTKNCVELKTDYDRITRGIIYVIYGYFLKLVIAERAAIPVNSVFGELNMEYGGIVLFLVAITYSLQIYADFAGYSAIVIGIAQVLGYDIPENFLAPYMSKNVKEFWSRWHVSLSTWLRDYVYIPLGGNRKGKIRKYINVILTFVISGLWHGLSWHFLVWGLLHGLFQLIGDITERIRETILPYIGIKIASAFHRLAERLVTFILVTFAWVFFRTGLRDAISFFIEMFTSLNLVGVIQGQLWQLGLQPFGWIILLISALVVFATDLIVYKYNKRIDDILIEQGAFFRSVWIIVVSLCILILGIYGDQHDASYFVYRDF